MGNHSQDIIIHKEKSGLYVSYCTVLDLYNQDAAAEYAKDNLIEAAELCIRSCLEHNMSKEIKNNHITC